MNQWRGAPLSAATRQATRAAAVSVAVAARRAIQANFELRAGQCIGPSILNAIHLKLKALAEVTTVPSRHRRRRDRNARAAGFSDGHSVPIYSPCHRCLLHISERNW